jgi:CHAD domain-containing protein
LAEGKWIEDLTASAPLADAARRVLAIRLDVVRQYLGRAVREPGKDSEYVHQLRVGTRRAGAALDIFATCLPEKTYRGARRALRNLRRAAGAARDWDVFLQALSEQAHAGAPRKHHPGIDCLIGYAFAQRSAAQQVLEEEGADPFAFDRLSAELLYAVQGPNEPAQVLLDLAAPILLGLLKDLDQAASADLTNYDNLHQVRIYGKRLRYAMEVFTCCFPAAFREVHYPAVEEMQEILGRANDSHVSVGRLTDLASRMQMLIPDEWHRYQSDLGRLLHFHEQRLPEERARFEEWWRHWQDDLGGKTALLELLQPSNVSGMKEEPGAV